MVSGVMRGWVGFLVLASSHGQVGPGSRLEPNSRVVASLWKVDDRATADLMGHFSPAMASERPLTPAAALQAAQRKLRESGVWSDPHHWAAFIPQGEWR